MYSGIMTPSNPPSAGVEGGGSVDVAADIHAATVKSTPVDADEEGYLDSTAGAFALVKRTWANTKAALKTYFDTLYSATGHSHTGMGDVVGPASSVDNAIPRFDGATGKLLQGASYSATISDEGNISINPTWNNAGTTFTGLSLTVTNTASAAASNLVGLKVGGATLLQVSKSGAVTLAPTETGTNIFTCASAISGYTGQFTGINQYGGLITTLVSTANNSAYAVTMPGDTYGRIAFGCDSGTPFLGFGPGGSVARDTFLYRGSAGLLEQRSGATAQGYNLYNNYTNASNYERATLSWGSNLLTIGTEAAGAGTARDILIKAASGKVRINDAARTPASATAAGSVGEVCWDSSYIYVCTATNTWVRAALSTW